MSVQINDYLKIDYLKVELKNLYCVLSYLRNLKLLKSNVATDIHGVVYTSNTFDVFFSKLK